MRNELKDNTLTLFFEGELNSYNADNIEKDIDETIKGKEFEVLTLDFSNLRYISSAGLRVVLKLKQKYDSTNIVETSLDVYDVFNMTGFTNMMSIKKALKRVYVSGAEIVGTGFFSTVYRVDKDTIIKVFNRVSDPEQIERELSLAKQAFILGVPTAISFDIVRVDDKLGVRFEMLDCDSLQNTFKKQPGNYDALVKEYVGLLRKINSIECTDPKIPNIKEKFLEKVDGIKEYLSKEQYEKLHKIISNIPERNTFVHGDCHFKNIMVQRDELLIIDMDTLSHGHPIFEIALLYCPYIAFEEDDKGNNERFLGFSTEFCNKLFLDLCKGYFDKFDDTMYDKIKLVGYIHMVRWNRINEPDNDKRFKGCLERLVALLEKYDDVDIGI